MSEITILLIAILVLELLGLSMITIANKHMEEKFNKMLKVSEETTQEDITWLI